MRLYRRDDSVPVSTSNTCSPTSSKGTSRPNVGGVVGLTDLYVDKALGFSLGWAAWVRTLPEYSVILLNSLQYNWAVTLRKASMPHDHGHH